MSVKDIDEGLRLWNIRLGAAAQNLLDVQSHPVYKRISAADSNLAGETASQSATAVRTLGYLLQCFDLLQSTITQAEEMRRNMPALFGADSHERQIRTLLQGKSIALPAVQVPFQQRSLLSSIENVSAISPSDLLGFMESAFESVKGIVLKLDAAWEALGRSIEGSAVRLSALQDQAEHLGDQERRELAAASSQLESLQHVASSDPLGAAARQLSGIDETVARIGQRLEQSRRDREESQRALTSARALVSNLKSEHEMARTAYQEAQEKAGYAVDFAASDRTKEALVAWFDRLSVAGGQAAPAALVVALSNWTHAAQQALDADRALLSAAKRLLATRLELRGRLHALKAKARAYSLAEDDELVVLADEATALLYGRPTPIEKAAALVADYEAKLNRQTRSSV